MPASSKTRLPRPLKPGTAKRRNRADSIQKFMDAALEVFSEVGFDAATTKAISQRAGLNDSLIQRYFVSKAGLFSALIIKFAEKISFEVYPPGLDVEEEVFNYLRTRYDSDTQNPRFVRVGFHRVMADPTFARSIGDKYRVSKLLVSRLKAFQKAGRIRPDVDVAALAQIISAQSFLLGVVEFAVLGKRTVDRHIRQLGAFARYISQGIVMGRR